MKLNINPKVRLALYIITSVGTPVMTYLLAKGVIGELEMILWAAEVTLVSTMAGFKVDRHN